MKRNFTLLAFLLCMLFSVAKAAETEPNNTKAQANTLALNGSNTGAVSPAGDVDWWKVTTNANGRLDITLTPTAGKYVWVYIYASNGTTELKSQNGASTFITSADGLAAGTYYIKVVAYYPTETTGYNISSKLVVPAQANDAEPNDTKAQAIVLPLNSKVTGHTGYFYSATNVRDTFDWYKVTLNADGRVRLRITSANGQYVWAYLYDNNGTTQLNANNTAGTVDINTDGLAAGTYYVLVKAYYNGGFAPYTLEDSLYKPAQANDVEPNNSKAQALTLPLNSSKTGHVGYRYNNARDTFDWYKVTLNADGRLRLRITSYNNQYVYAYLYDNNGTTELASQYTNGTVDVVRSDLAAGTYYVRVNNYYNYEFAPYKLEDSLFLPAEANDQEPNNTAAQAVTLAPNTSTTGHVGYLSGGIRDTADWYKITTTQDGALKLFLTPTNGKYAYIYLYDKDAKTLLNSSYSDGPFTQITDGLAAGTYHVRINCYYTSDFAPYKLTDSLLTYKPNDAESNAKPYLAKTLLANTANSGHVGFYYNKVRDTLDWWKINYTGSGPLTVTLNLDTPKAGSPRYTWLEVYKDTNATALFSNYTTTSLTASLTSLTQGYYYVKVRTYYSSDYQAYTLTPTFTQNNIAKVQLSGRVNALDCSATNKLTLKCTGSKPPYRVVLYRYGVEYRTLTVKNNAAFSFDTLPPGVYKVNAYGDGASGTAFGTVSATFVPIPQVLTVTNIQPTQAKLNWDVTSCAKYYQVQYRALGATTWITKKTVGNKNFINATGLTANTSYEWHVAAADSANGTSGVSPYSVLDTFNTSTAKGLIAEKLATPAPAEADKMGDAAITTYPNPATTQFVIQMQGSKLQGTASLWLTDMNGKIVWSKQQVQADALRGMQVDVSKLASGMYMLQIVNGDNQVITVKKIIVSK